MKTENYVFHYDDKTVTTICGNTFYLQEIGSLTRESEECYIYVHGTAYRIYLDTYRYLSNIFIQLPS